MTNKRHAFVALACAWALAAPALSAANETSPSPRDERPLILLSTNAGDMVAELYPEIAPETVKQFVKLVDAGVYDGLPFHRLIPYFVAQVSNEYQRLTPLTSQQKSLIHPIPGEFGTKKHLRGILSMARADGDVNSGEVSFSILLGDAPHLDGKYTVFGMITIGLEVIDAIEETRTDQRDRPKTPVILKRAKRVTAQELKTLKLAVGAPLAASPPEQHQRDLFFVVVFLLEGALGAALFYGAKKWTPRTTGSLGLLGLLIGGFATLVTLMPSIQDGNAYAGTVALATMLAVYRLMSRFESV